MPTAEQLSGFILRFIKAGEREPGERVAVRAEFGDEYFHLFGLIQRVRRIVQGYALLRQKSFSTEARILARVALEHAVTGQWIFYTKGGLDRFRVSVSRDEYNLRKAVGVKDKARLKGLEDAIIAGKGMPSWTDIRVDLDAEIGYVAHAYSVLSQIVHVTHSTVLDALEVTDDGLLYLRHEPAPALELEVLHIVAASSILAWWLEAVMTGDADLQERLHENSHELAMAMRLDQNLPEAKRRDVGPPQPVH